MILYSNGCSYTGNQWVKLEQRYQSLLADRAEAELHERAIPGSCNERIIRCTMRDCLELMQQGKTDIVVMVQLTHLYRTEISATANPQAWKYALGDLFESVKPFNTDEPEFENYVSEHIKLNTELALFDKLCADVLGLVSFFKLHKIRYLVFAGPTLLDNEKERKIAKTLAFYQHLCQEPSVLDMLNFSMLGVANTDKHPVATEYATIAAYFYNRYYDYFRKSNFTN